MIRNLLLAVCLLSYLGACSDVESETYKPYAIRDQRRIDRGKLTGDEGLSMFNGKDQKDGGGNSAIAVNSFLWRATLDTLSFMPLASADPFGGVVITDWYENPETPGERFKVNALILDRTLRADGIKLTLFKQKVDKAGAWRDTAVDHKMERSLEDTILTRARELKVSQLGGK
jgi:hypothetical protein